jgi:hypothetical protein
MIVSFLRSVLLRQRQLGLRDVGEEVLHGHVHHIGKGLRIKTHEKRQRGKHAQNQQLAAIDVRQRLDVIVGDSTELDALVHQ